jgi:hypothetical protein
LERRDISDTGTRRLQHELKEFMAHFPADKVLEIAMDYLANDEEVRQSVAYVQSEEFPKIHKTVEQLQEYKNVSAFICMFLKPQSNAVHICSISN